MNRVIIFVALSTASFLAAYAEGAVDAPWSTWEAAPDTGAVLKLSAADQGQGDGLAQRRAIWHWAGVH